MVTYFDRNEEFDLADDVPDIKVSLHFAGMDGEVWLELAEDQFGRNLSTLSPEWSVITEWVANNADVLLEQYHDAMRGHKVYAKEMATGH